MTTTAAPRPTIALAAHRLAAPLERLTGLGRYVVSLSRALATREAYEYVLAAPFEETDPAPDWAPAPVVRLGGDRRLLLAAWSTLGRPPLDRLLPPVDLVHVLGPVAPVPARVPTVYTIHDLFPLSRPDWSPRRGTVMFRAVARAARRAARVIVPSRVVADQVAGRLDIPPRRITIVPEAVDDVFRHPPPGLPDLARRHGLARDRYWLALGSAVPRKNLAFAVRAAAAVPASDRLPLVIAGPGSRRAGDLVALAADLGLAGDVLLAGYVPENELPGLVAGARALVHPALDEGFGLPPLEAMAAGTPVVATAAGAIPEVVGDAGLLLPPGDLAGWTGALSDLARDDGLRADLAVRGRDRAAAFTWARTAERTEDVYAACLP